MAHEAETGAFPAPDSPEYDLILVAQSLLKRQVATAVLTGSGDERIVAALAEITEAMKRDVREPLSGIFSRDDLTPTAHVLERAARVIGNRDLVTLNAGPVHEQGASDVSREGRSDDVPDASGGTRRGEGSSPRGGDTPRGDGGEVVPGRRGSPRYHLTVYLTKVTAHRLTPGLGADEFRVTGGYTYTGALIGPDGVARDKTMSMTGWEHGFSSNGQSASEMVDHLPYMLLSEAIPQGSHQLMMTLTPTEEDAVSTETARAIGRFASVLMTAGLDVVVGLAVAAGHTIAPGAASLTGEAQQLIRDHAVPGLVGLIQQALGPELFTMPLMRVDTSWTPGTPVQWSSWGWYASTPTTPAAGAGAATRNAVDIRIDEIRIRPDANNVLRQTTVAGGGTYTLDVRFVMTEA
jgi:hypothetical protein